MQDETQRLKGGVPLLLEWFRASKRDLPWRHGRSPYTVLVSELMLQQTRVEAVKERYIRFLRRFPTAEALAAASEEEVLKEWEGLGYYSRARNLHRAAKIVSEEGFPQTWEGVRALPGVGDYTAGAICSIALGMKTAAVDGNVLRILTRFFADPRRADGALRKAYSALLEQIYPDPPWEFTEALMELGAIVCVPNGPPMCGACPWSGLCKAHLAGKEEDFPLRTEKRKRTVFDLCVYVLEREGRYALEKRPEKGLLSGLYGFPMSPPENQTYYGEILATKRAKHIFTHAEWRMTGYLVAAEREFPQFVWASPREIRETYAVPSAFKAFLGWIGS